MTKIETAVARHDEKIKDLEERAGERRDGEIELFKKLEAINKGIGELKTDFAGWKGRVAILGPLAMIVISAGITLVVKLLAG